MAPRRIAQLWHTIRALGVLALLSLGAITLVAVLTIVQGQEDEARPVEAIVVLYPPTNPGAFVDHGVDLYRQGLAPRLVLVGTATAEQRISLIGQGIPEPALLVIEHEHGGQTRLTAVRDTLYARGTRQVLLVQEADDLLLTLKIAGDLGLEAYGSPVPATERPFDLQALLQTSLAYWRYVLLGRD